MTFSNGLEFDDVLAQNIKDLVDRIDRKKAALIVISGPLGEGKTTLMIHILDYVNKLRGLPPIDLAGPQVAMGGADFVDKLKLCHEQKLPCIGYDEAGDFSKRTALTKFNGMLNRTFDTFRAFKCLVVVAVPNFNVLDNNLFENKVPRLLLVLKDRDNTRGNYAGYSLQRIEYLRARMRKLDIKNFAYSIIHPNFYGHFHDLDQQRSEQLDLICTQNKMSILSKSVVEMEGLYTYDDLATKLERSIYWCMKGVKKLGLNPKRIIHRTNYYPSEVLYKLSELINEKGKDDGCETA